MLGKLKNKIVRCEEQPEQVTKVEVRVEGLEEECPDGGYGWIICLAAAIIQFIILGIHNNFGILYTYFLNDLHAEPSDTGKYFAIF